MALPNDNILPGAAPLLWSNVKEAFDKINENFTALDLATGGASVNLETLNTTVAPAYDNTYALGKLGTNRWKSVFLAEYHDTPADAANGVYIGSAHIKGIGSHIDLPNGSTIVGVPIKEPFFNSVQVDNDNRVEANTTSAPWGETLNLLSGNGIQMTVSSGADSITFDNTGILSVVPNSGISATTVAGVTTITNTGVRSVSSTTALPSGRTAGAGINIDNSTGDNIKFTNTGVLSIEAGSAALTISTDSATGIVTITNAAPAGNTFRFVVVNGDTGSPIEADSVSDILNFAEGQGITLSKNTTTDTVTIAVNPVFDLKGSIFGDDSTKIVDAVENKIYSTFFGNLTGDVAGNISAITLRTSETEIALGGTNPRTSQGTGSVAIGSEAGESSQGLYAVGLGWSAGRLSQGDAAVAIGYSAGDNSQGQGAVAIGADASNTSQGDYSIAIGNLAGGPNQGANSIAIGKNAGNGGTFAGSIILSATGSILTSSAAGFYVDPIRSTANGTPLMYNSTTKELFYSTVLEFIGSKISTSDSSGLTVDVQTTFNTDVTFENDIIVAERLTLKGSRVINLADLKTIVAASTDFANFQSRIAALV